MIFFFFCLKKETSRDYLKDVCRHHLNYIAREVIHDHLLLIIVWLNSELMEFGRENTYFLTPVLPKAAWRSEYMQSESSWFVKV